MFYSPRIKAVVFFLLVLGKENSSLFFFIKQKEKFLFVLNFIIKDYKSVLLDLGKVPEYTAITGPRKNEREVAKTTALSIGKNRKKIEKFLL